MPRMIFVNLPVADVEASVAFYEAIGATKDARFSQPGQAAAMIWSDTITFMLLDPEFFATFTDKRIIDSRAETGALLALSLDSRAEVDAVTRAALAAGGRELHEPEDLGFMYSRAFEDLDGHGWGPMYMDVDAFTAATAPAAQAA